MAVATRRNSSGQPRELNLIHGGNLHLSSIVNRTLIIRLMAAIGALPIAGYACTTIADPPLDSRAEQFQPPAVYARWWTMAESCSGLSSSFADVTWFQVPASDVVENNGKEVGGYWAPVSNSIVLAGNLVLDGSLVRHEMLHALIRARSGHRREYFLERCGGVVFCDSLCVEDAGSFPTPGSSVARVSSDVLEVSVSLMPSLPLQSTDGGLFTVVVSARNTKEYPVVVQLYPSWSKQTFSVAVFGPLGGLGNSEMVRDPEFVFFQPGEVKQHYFDLQIGSKIETPSILPPASYTLVAGYDTKYLTRENVQIGSTAIK